jgi:hypothetical protein
MSKERFFDALGDEDEQKILDILYQASFTTIEEILEEKTEANEEASSRYIAIPDAILAGHVDVMKFFLNVFPEKVILYEDHVIAAIMGGNPSMVKLIYDALPTLEEKRTALQIGVDHLLALYPRVNNPSLLLLLAESRALDIDVEAILKNMEICAYDVKRVVHNIKKSADRIIADAQNALDACGPEIDYNAIRFAKKLCKPHAEGRLFMEGPMAVYSEGSLNEDGTVKDPTTQPLVSIPPEYTHYIASYKKLYEMGCPEGYKDFFVELIGPRGKITEQNIAKIDAPSKAATFVQQHEQEKDSPSRGRTI